METTTEYTQLCLASPDIRRLCLATLPRDVLFEIFSKLDDVLDFVHLMQVCKLFYEYLNVRIWKVNKLRIYNASSLDMISDIFYTFRPLIIHLKNLKEDALRAGLIVFGNCKKVTIDGFDSQNNSKFSIHGGHLRKLKTVEKVKFLNVRLNGYSFHLPDTCHVVKFVNVHIDFVLVNILNNFKLKCIYFDNCTFDGASDVELLNIPYILN